MANKRVENDKANSFIIYKDYETYIETLSREQKGDIFSALFVYFRTGEIPDELDNESKILMKVFAVQMDRDLKKYDKKVEARRKAGIKSAEAKKLKQSLDNLNEYDDEENFSEVTSIDSTDEDFITDSSTDSTFVTFVEHSSSNSTNSTNNSNNNNNSNSNSNNNNNNNNNSNNNFNSNDNDNKNNINAAIDMEQRMKQIYARLYENDV